MTTGYLWEGQFKEELTKVIEEGQPHSMELDTNSLDGHWAKDNNLGVEFFIINDAVFSKLCILGDDVEPCFEGSSVTATSSEVSDTFSIDQKFSRTLYSMMNELTDALQSKGGLEMPKKFAEQAETTEVKSAIESEEVKSEEFASEEEVADNTDAETAPEAEVEGEFEAEDDDKDDSEAKIVESSENKEEDEEAPAKTYSEEEYAALMSENESLRAEVESLREFKLSVENEQKDALFEQYPFNTLSAEDIAEVKEHKSEYSLEEIKSKLAVIFVEKGVQFGVQETEKSAEDTEDEDAITTFSLDGEVTGPMSDLQEALRNTVH